MSDVGREEVNLCLFIGTIFVIFAVGFSFGQPAAASSGFGGGFGTTMTTTSAPSTGKQFRVCCDGGFKRG